MAKQSADREFTGVTFGAYSSQKNAVSIGVSIPIKSVYAALGRGADAIFSFFGGSRLEVKLETMVEGDSPDVAGQQRIDEMVVGRSLEAVADVASCRCNGKFLSFTLSCMAEELEFGELEHFKFETGVLHARRTGAKPKKRPKDQPETPDPNQSTIPFPDEEPSTSRLLDPKRADKPKRRSPRRRQTPA